MKNLRETLEVGFKSYGHFNVSVVVNGVKYSTVTTNTMAVDAYNDEDLEEGGYYETMEEAQDALINEVLRDNDLD
jgi:hypothetical protein